jgi:hypothetical protein
MQRETYRCVTEQAGKEVTLYNCILKVSVRISAGTPAILTGFS